METRFQRIFLMLATAVLLYAPHTLAQRDANPEEATILDEVIQPDLKRRKIKEDQIDTENFELGAYAGVMSVEDFGSNNTTGYRLAYHISEDWFLEGAYGETVTGESTAESLFGIGVIEEDARVLEYTNVSLGVNLFPGEIFLGKNYAFNSHIFIILGIGDTSFGGDEFFTYNFGGGFRLLITDWLAYRLDFRNHVFTHNLLGEEKSIQNLETNMGLSIFF
ncbi:MAG: outer membrane beta-barrel domain-containing protein [Agarilytica sp.]